MSGKKHYDQYIFGVKDWITFLVVEAGKVLLISYLFFDSILGVGIALPFAWFDYRSMKRRKCEQQRLRLIKQFKSMMESIVNSLHAGYSLEHAFEDAKRDLTLLYQKDAYIFSEINAILEGIKMRIPVEQLLADFGRRSGIDDVRNFANVVIAAKRNGGNLIHIMEKTVNRIADKLAVEEEIKTMIAAKRLEEKIMMMTPYGIIFYLRMTSGFMMEVLYHNLLGVALMLMFLSMIYVADLWAQKIMEIPV